MRVGRILEAWAKAEWTKAEWTKAEWTKRRERCAPAQAAASVVGVEGEAGLLELLEGKMVVGVAQQLQQLALSQLSLSDREQIEELDVGIQEPPEAKGKLVDTRLRLRRRLR